MAHPECTHSILGNASMAEPGPNTVSLTAMLSWRTLSAHILYWGMPPWLSQDQTLCHLQQCYHGALWVHPFYIKGCLHGWARTKHCVTYSNAIMAHSECTHSISRAASMAEPGPNTVSLTAMLSWRTLSAPILYQGLPPWLSQDQALCHLQQCYHGALWVHPFYIKGCLHGWARTKHCVTNSNAFMAHSECTHSILGDASMAEPGPNTVSLTAMLSWRTMSAPILY